MEQHVCLSRGVGWTSEIVKSLALQLLDVCTMLQSEASQLAAEHCDKLPQSESDLLTELQSQLLNMFTFDPGSGTPKYVILDHFVAILQDLIPQLLKAKVISESHYQIVDHLLGIFMLMIPLSESNSETMTLNGTLNNLFSQVKKVSRLDPVNELKGYLFILIETFTMLMQNLKQMYISAQYGESKITNMSKISKEEVLQHLVESLQETISHVMGANRVRGKDNVEILDFFVRILQQVTSSIMDEVESEIGYKIRTRGHLIGMIMSLLSLLVNESEMTFINEKLKDMLLQLLNMTKLNPVIQIPENIQFLLEIDPGKVPKEMMFDHLKDINDYLWSLFKSALSHPLSALEHPVVWLPRNLLLLFTNLPRMLVWTSQSKLQSHLKKLLNPSYGKLDDTAMDPVCVLPVELLPLLGRSRRKFEINYQETLELATAVFKEIHPALVDIFMAEWRKEILYCQIEKSQILSNSEFLKNLQFDGLDITQTSKYKNLDYLLEIIQEKLTQVVGNDRARALNLDEMLEMLVTALKFTVSGIKDEGLSKTTKTEIRDLLIGIIKGLLSFLENIPEVSEIKEKLKDLLSQYLNMTSLDPVTETQENLRLLLAMNPENVPISWVVYYINGMFEYLRSFIESGAVPIFWLSRNMVLLCMSVCKLLPWNLQTKLQSHLKRILEPVSEVPGDQTSKLVSVLPVDLLPILIHVAKLTKLYKNEVLNPANMFLQRKIVSRMEKQCQISKDFLSELMNVCKMLPENDLIQDLWSQLESVVQFTDTFPASGKLNSVILDHLVAILQDLLLLAMEFNPHKRILKKKVLHMLYESINSLMTQAENLPKTASVSQLLKDMLSVLSRSVYMPIVEMNEFSRKFKDFLSEVMEVCMMLPENKLVLDLKSQLVNIFHWTKPDTVSGTPKDPILDHLIAILRDLLKQATEMNPGNELLKNQIFDRLYGSMKGLQSVTKNIYLFQMLQGMILWIDNITCTHLVTEIWTNLSSLWEVFRVIHSQLVDVFTVKWRDEMIYNQMKKDEMIPEKELHKTLESDVLNISKITKDRILDSLFSRIHDKLSLGNILTGISENQVMNTYTSIQQELMSQVIDNRVSGDNKNQIWDYSIGIIQEKLSQRMKVKAASGVSKYQMLDQLVEILQKLTCQVEDGSVLLSGIPKNEIRELLIGTIKALLLLLVNETELSQINKKLEKMLSQLVNMSSLNPVIETHGNLCFLEEVCSESVTTDWIVDHLREIKDYLQSLSNSSIVPVVWLARELLLICLGVPKLLPHASQNRLQTHLEKLLDSKGKNVVSMLPVDLVPLLKVLEFLISMNDKSKEELSKVVDTSKIECTSNNFKDLLSQLMNLCNMFPKNQSIQDTWVKLINLYGNVPATEILKNEILDILIVILEDLTSELMRIDPEKGIHKGIMDDNTVSILQKEIGAQMERDNHISSGKYKNILVDHYVAIFQDAMSSDMQGSVTVIPKNQVLDEFVGILKSLQSLLVNVPETSTTNEKLESMVVHVNESRMKQKITKEIKDPEREALRCHGTQILTLCQMLPESESLKDLISHVEYLCLLASEIPKSVMFDSLLKIHQDVSGLVSKSDIPPSIINDQLEETYKGLISGMGLSSMEPVTDLMSRLLNLLTCDPKKELLKELQTRIMKILNLLMMDPAEIPTDQICGIFFLIIRPLLLNIHGITKEEMAEHLRAIGEYLVLLLQNVHLVEAAPRKSQPHDTKEPSKEMPYINKDMLRSSQGEKRHSQDHLAKVIQQQKQCKETYMHKLMITKNVLLQIINESSTEWTSQAIEYVVRWVMDVCDMLPESELLKDLQKQLVIVSLKINTGRGNFQLDVILDHLVGILKDLISQVQQVKDVNETCKNQIVDDVTGVTMGLMSLVGNITVPKLIPTYEILKDMLSYLNDIRMDPETKAFKDMFLSMLTVLSMKNNEDLQEIECSKGIFSYLLAISLNVSNLIDVRVNLKYFLSHIMNIPRTDPVSGMPKDLLSLLVYNFFPASHTYFHMQFGSHQKMPQYIAVTDLGQEIIYTGSMPEYLHLPCIYDLFKHEISYPDVDHMIHTGWLNECYQSMSWETDEAQPIFCKIKHGMALDWVPQSTGRLFAGILNGVYLNSAKINHIFRRYQTDLPQHKKSTPKSEYDSASVVFTVGQSVTHDDDVLFCLPVTLNEDFKQNFLKRLKINKWPMNSNSELGRLLTEAVYAIPKPDPNSKDGDLRWRLSFSVVEVELARSLNDIQRRCYRVLKAIIKFVVNKDLPEKRRFPSYFLKTLMFWFCESTPEESWKIQYLGIQWLKLLDSVIESLEKKELFMYFIPTYNLMKDKDAASICVWKERLKKIRQNPLDAFIQFWSVYDIAVSPTRADVWGYSFLNCLTNLKKTFGNLLVTNAATTYTCHWTVVKYMLATLSLEDFLHYMKIFPQTNKLMIIGKAESNEHLIWMYYNWFLSAELVLNAEFSQNLQVRVRENYSKYWSYFAEVTHHMVLKYKDKVPDKDLFSKQTAGRFHLITCIIQNKSEKLNSNQYIKYANYLRADERYEEAVHVLMNLCQRFPTQDFCTFSRVTSEVLDTWLKMTVSFQDDINYPSYIFEHHLLTQCYIERGVLAEVCFCFSEEKDWKWWKVVLGFQFIICGQLHEAFQTFAGIEAFELLSYNIKFAAMLYIIARLSNL